MLTDEDIGKTLVCCFGDYWTKEREKYLYNGTITNQNLREIRADEIIIEFDFTKDGKERFEDAQAEAKDWIKILSSHLEGLNYSFYITDHKGKCPHIRFRVKGLENYPLEQRKNYKLSLVKEHLETLEFKSILVKLDESLLTSSSKLISIENQPHFKEKWNGAIEEIIFENKGKENKIDTSLIKDIPEEQTFENIPKVSNCSAYDKFILLAKDNKLSLGDGQSKNDKLIKNYSGLVNSKEDIISFCNLIKKPNSYGLGWFKKNITFNCTETQEYFEEYFPEVFEVCKSCKNCVDSLENKDLPTISLKQMLANGIPKMNWIVDSIIPQRGVVVFGGTSGSNKTWTAMHLALCCASGNKFLGHFETKKCRVLYIDEENGDVTIPNRFSMLIKGRELESEWDNLEISIFNNIKLDTKDCPNFKTLIDRTKPEIVFIDSMVRCMVGEEDKAKDVRVIFENLKIVLEEHPNITFIILHHTAKGNSRDITALRGSGDFVAFADVVLMFAGTKEGYANVKVAKNRHVDLRKLPDFSIDIDGVEDESIKLSYTPDKSGKVDYIKYCIADLIDWFDDENLDGFMTKEAITCMGKKGHKRNAIYSALSELVLKGDISKLRRGQYRVVNKVFRVEEEEVV